MTNTPVNLDGQTRTGETIELDGGSFIGATLKGCRLIYRGGAVPECAGLAVEHPNWEFADAALNTMGMLALIGIFQPEAASQLFSTAAAMMRAILSEKKPN